jgi:hypothetical protein
MSLAGDSCKIVVWAALAGAAACAGVGVGCQSNEPGLTGPHSCTVRAPCPDDPAKTCDVPCKGDAAGSANGGGSGGTGTGGAAGAGGTGGGTTTTVTPVDASGSVVEFASTAFVETTPYIQPVDIFAPAANGDTLHVTSMQGSFSLVAAAQGNDWVFAQDAAGSTALFPTYSPQKVETGKPLVVPLVPADVLAGVATQLGVPTLVAGRAHLVLRAVNKNGTPIPGVAAVALTGATLGYDTGPGSYAPNTGATGNFGFVIQLNVNVAGPGVVKVATTSQYGSTLTDVPISADAVTYGYLPVPNAP